MLRNSGSNFAAALGCWPVGKYMVKIRVNPFTVAHGGKHHMVSAVPVRTSLTTVLDDGS